MYRIILNLAMAALIVGLIFRMGQISGEKKGYIKGYHHRQIEMLPEIGIQKHKTAMKYENAWG